MANKEQYRREFKAIKEAVDRFLESDDEELLVPMSDGSTMRLSRDPDAPGGVRVGDANADYHMENKTFNADERPEDFPEAVPFLGGISTMVTSLGEPSGLFAVVWMMVPDVEERFAEVLRWHGDAGWKEVEEAEDPGPILEQARENAKELMKQRGMSAEDIRQRMDVGSELFRSSRRVRLEKDRVKRGLSMTQLKENAGVINLFEKSIDAD